MKSNDIINKSDLRSKTRAKRQSLVAKLYKVDGNKVIYTVTSSQGDKQYLVTILLLSLTGNKLKSLKSALQGDIKISCTCPAFLFQGYKYISWKKQVGIDKELRSPDIRNPNKEGLACKHILVALEQLKSDYNKVYDLFKKYNQDKPVSKQANKIKSEFTEEDISTLTKFQEECSLLYNEYAKYIKMTRYDDFESSFVESKYYTGVDPSKLLQTLSKPALKLVSSTFIGNLDSLDTIIGFMQRKRNGFNILVRSDVEGLIKKINSNIKSITESYINNIILSLIEEHL